MKTRGCVQIMPIGRSPFSRDGVLYWGGLDFEFATVGHTDQGHAYDRNLAIHAAAKAGEWLLSQGWPRPAYGAIAGARVRLGYQGRVPNSAVAALVEEITKAIGRKPAAPERNSALDGIGRDQ